MEKQLTPPQALREYFLHRSGEMKSLRNEIERIRHGWWIGRRARTRNLIKHTTFLRNLTRFIIEHRNLALPTTEELATLEHDLRVFESIHAEAVERLQD